MRLKAQYIEDTFIPSQSELRRSGLCKFSNACGTAATERLSIQTAVRHRILDLAPPGKAVRLSQKLEAWHALDFAAFRAEVLRLFKSDIPLKERGAWEAYLAENAAEVAALTAAIEAAEREIDAIVYRLFDLDAAEIALLEASLAGQY